jgi:tetratricopeptide (TPR) repeat protein
VSSHPISCRGCKSECAFERAGPYPGKGEERTYAVAWICPRCSRKSLDVCPLGPLVPSASSCLNCGADYVGEGDEAGCAGCGLAKSAVRAALGVERVAHEPLAAAKEAFQRGLIRRGMAILNGALQHDLGLTDAWSLKCSFLDSLGYVGTKERMLETALAAGAPAALWLSYGFTLQQQERHAEAANAYGRYRELMPSSPWTAVACGNEANSRTRLGQHDDAEKLYRRALELEPERLSHSHNFIRFLIDQRRLPEALSALDTALEGAAEDGDLIPLLEDRTAILAEQGNPSEALESIDAAVKRGSDSVRTHFLRGRVLGLLGRLEEARVEILRVLALDPQHAAAKEGLETIDAVLIWGRLPRPADQ